MSNYPISQPLADLLDVFNKRRKIDIYDTDHEQPRVKIHETTGRMAFVYEKIRTAVDYQEENLIRKNAIARMLKRRIVSGERGLNITEPLIRELIRAGYLKNNYFPVSRIPDIETIINKYLELINQMVDPRWIKQNNKTLNWIISVASFEIEEYLAPSIIDDALVESMYKILRQNINLSDEVHSPTDEDIQIYIAMHRALIKSDSAMLRYHLLYYYYPGWRYATKAEIPAFAKQLGNLIPHIEQQINNKISDRLFRYVRKFAPIFIILKDVVMQNPENIQEIMSEPQKLEAAARQAYQKRYQMASSRLTRGIIRSIIYIFLTKTILAFIVEWPYEKIFLEEVQMLPLIINIVFHPILMYLIATMIHIPAEKNIQMILQGANEAVYDLPEKKFLSRKEERIRSRPVLDFIFSLVYFLTFFITFGVIIWIIYLFNFSLVSGFLFIFFLCVISFFGLRLRHNAMELVVYSKRENLLMIVFDFLSLPVLRAGRWISKKTSKVNIFMFVLDFIIEAPFKILVETIEDWFAYQRKKKEEII